MTKLLSAMVAAMFAVVTVSPVLAADDAKKDAKSEMKKKADDKKADKSKADDKKADKAK